MDRTSILNAYVTDMAAVESHIHDAVERQASTDAVARHPEAKAALTRLQTTLKRHVEALEAYNAGTEGGGLREMAKEALGTALGVAAGLYGQLRQQDPASRTVRDAYTATGLAVISYHMLYTTALGLKEQRLADLSIQHLKDLTPIVGDLSEAVCRVVAAELTEEDKMIDASVAAEAVRATQEAWSRA